MSFTEQNKISMVKTDTYVWGNEKIIWGYEPSHQYTLKILEPKKGRMGCLSLQYHHEKSESWVMLEGMAWALIVGGGKLMTRILRHGDVQTLERGVIHRLMGISDGAKVIEASTPDQHAADKNKIKDVVRLHCVHGRECTNPGSKQEEQIIKLAIEVTEAAIFAIDSGKLPESMERVYGPAVKVNKKVPPK